MRNHEGYMDPTASKAITPKTERLSSITGPERKRPAKKNPVPMQKKTVYYAEPAFVRR